MGILDAFSALSLNGSLAVMMMFFLIVIIGIMVSYMIIAILMSFIKEWNPDYQNRHKKI